MAQLFTDHFILFFVLLFVPGDLQNLRFRLFVPPGFLVFDGFYFFEGIKAASVDAGASHGRDVPLVRRVQIERPKRPGAALVGTDRIDRAATAAALFGR